MPVVSTLKKMPAMLHLRPQVPGQGHQSGEGQAKVVEERCLA
jgi:hypothetical protein